MSSCRLRAVFAACLLLPAGTLRAQVLKRPIEIGIDGQLTASSGDVSATWLSAPVSLVRVGLAVTDRVEIEPAFSVDYTTSGGDHATSYGVGAGVIWNLSADHTRRQWYVRPFGEVAGAEGSGGVNDWQYALGAGFGVRLPVVPMLSTRLEANVGHWFAHGDTPTTTDVGLSFGLSFWTR